MTKEITDVEVIDLSTDDYWIESLENHINEGILADHGKEISDRYHDTINDIAKGLDNIAAAILKGRYK